MTETPLSDAFFWVRRKHLRTNNQPPPLFFSTMAQMVGNSFLGNVDCKQDPTGVLPLQSQSLACPSQVSRNNRLQREIFITWGPKQEAYIFGNQFSLCFQHICFLSVTMTDIFRPATSCNSWGWRGRLCNPA